MMILMVLMNSGQVLYRMSFKGGLSDVFLMVRLRLWVLERKTTEVKR